MIGIIGALSVEIEHLLARMEHKETEEFSGIRFTRGAIDGRDVVCAVCGVGKVFAAMCAQTMILRYSPALVINTGVAGTLSPDLHIGSIAVAEDVAQHDFDLSPLGFIPSLIPGVDTVKIPCDKRACEVMRACADEAGLNTLTGTIATGDIFVSDGETKARLRRDYGAIACEMEGGSIGHVCYVNKVPFLVIRSISDEADGNAHEDYGEFMKNAAKNSADTVARFISRF